MKADIDAHLTNFNILDFFKVVNYNLVMSCEHPILALDLGIFNGKHKIKVLPKRVDMNIKSLEARYGKDALLLLPCGHCPSCRLSKLKEWSVRCELESRLYDRNCFVTLTYDDEHCPMYLRKDDLKQFIKALRNLGFKFRYFACGEYGEKSGRPHFHIVLFNFLPCDVKPYALSKSGGMMLRSATIEKCWKYNGICTVQDFESGFAAYVAGYVAKKEIQELPDDFIGHEPFLLMSNRPGIAYDYFKLHQEDLIDEKCVVLKNGKISFLPRYFKKIVGDEVDLTEYTKDNLDAMRLLQNAEMLELGIEHREQLLLNKGREMKDKLYRRKRGL